MEYVEKARINEKVGVYPNTTLNLIKFSYRSKLWDGVIQIQARGGDGVGVHVSNSFEYFIIKSEDFIEHVWNKLISYVLIVF